MERVIISYTKVSNSCIELNGVQNWIDFLLFNLNSASVYFYSNDNSESESGANLLCSGAEELRDNVSMALDDTFILFIKTRDFKSFFVKRKWISKNCCVIIEKIIYSLDGVTVLFSSVPSLKRVPVLIYGAGFRSYTWRYEWIVNIWWCVENTSCSLLGSVKSSKKSSVKNLRLKGDTSKFEIVGENKLI